VVSNILPPDNFKGPLYLKKNVNDFSVFEKMRKSCENAFIFEKFHKNSFCENFSFVRNFVKHGILVCSCNYFSFKKSINVIFLLGSTL
jgi:hypothetical protein